MQKIIKCLSTFFYLGYLPKAPGTFASIAAVLIYLCVFPVKWLFYLTTFIIIFVGFMVCGRAERVFSEHDPRIVVIDEVSGMLISFIFVPFSWLTLLLGFSLFRIFDIAKPFPINAAQKLKSSAGIMLDDIIAGIFTNICLQFFSAYVLTRLIIR